MKRLGAGPLLGAASSLGAASLLCVVSSVLSACAGVDPDDGSSSDLLQMQDPGLGTESGNPTEPSGALDGTESGNPGLVETSPAASLPAEQNGTESGNPTRPPPGVEVCVAVPETGATDPQDSQPAAPAPEGTLSPGVGSSPYPATASPEPAVAPTSGATAGDPCFAPTCAAEADALASTYTQSLPAPTPFSEATCSPSGECSCFRDGVATVLREAEPSACLVAGRLGCVYSADEYSTCSAEELDAAAPTSCAQSCSALFAAQQADAAGFEASVRASACTVAGCRFVLATDSACFVAGSGIAPTEGDCSLSDDELLSSR